MHLAEGDSHPSLEIQQGIKKCYCTPAMITVHLEFALFLLLKILSILGFIAIIRKRKVLHVEIPPCFKWGYESNPHVSLMYVSPTTSEKELLPFHK